MARRASLVLLLLGVLLALPPLAHASPPDPTWIGAGFFDDGDHDDVVLAITSAVSVTESGVAHAVEPVAVCLGLIKLAGPKPLPAGPLGTSRNAVLARAAMGRDAHTSQRETRCEPSSVRGRYALGERPPGKKKGGCVSEIRAKFAPARSRQ